MDAARLPLLHKYVLLPGDDAELTLAKLRYRLCVMEVIQSKVHRHVGYGLDSEAGRQELMMMKSDADLICNDSGIALDDSHDSQVDTSVLNFFEVALAGAPRNNDVDDDDDDGAYTTPLPASPDSPVAAAPRRPLTPDPTPISVEIRVTDCDDTTTSDWETFCEPPGTGEEEREEEGEEREEEESKEEREEEGEEEGEEAPLVDFTTGIKCTDVDTALAILKTRYRLADITVRRAIITWSAWNIADIVHTPYESLWWWSSKLPGLGNKYSCQLKETEEIPETREQITQRAAEIETLLAEVLEKDRLEAAQREEEEEKRREEPAVDGDDGDDDVDDAQPLLAVEPTIAAATDEAPPLEEKKKKKKKRGSVFARMMRALRRGFSGARHGRRRD